MPKVSAKLTLSRQWQTLRRIPQRPPGVTAGELADYLRHDCGFSLTKRTVERDLVELATLFPLTTVNEEKPFRWRWAEGAKFDVSGLDLPDALALALAEQIVSPLLPGPLLHALSPRFALARTKLASLDENKLARWREKVRHVPAALEFQAPQIPPQVLAAVQTALLEDRQIEVLYRGPSDRRSKDLVLHPLVFIQRGPVPYLVATAFDYPDPRLYTLHRMTTARASDLPRTVPPNFSADSYLRSGALGFGGGGTIALKARLSPELACYLTETPLDRSQKIIPSGDHHVLRADLTDSWQLRFWILSQGEGITVLSPASLRREIRAQLQAALAAYE